MTRMTDEREARREKVESALGALGIMRVEIRLARIRVQQAADRWPGSHYLLGPVLAYLVKWERAAGAVAGLCRDMWLLGNANGWFGKDGQGESPELLPEETEES